MLYLFENIIQLLLNKLNKLISNPKHIILCTNELAIAVRCVWFRFRFAILDWIWILVTWAWTKIAWSFPFRWLHSDSISKRK